MPRALAEGFTLLLGGDCSLVAGSLAGARRALGQPVGLVYIDADADLNTQQTTPSGFLDGMALSLALGRCESAFATAGGPAPGWRASTWRSSATAPSIPASGRRWGPGPGAPGGGGEAPRYAGGGRPGAGRRGEHGRAGAGPSGRGRDRPGRDAPEAAPDHWRGLSLAECSDLLTALLASPRVVALELVEYDPDHDPDGRGARALVELLARAVARRLRR